MGDFRSFQNDRREGGFSRPRSGGFSRRPEGRGFGGGRDRDFGRRDREERVYSDAVCSKCGKDCKLPFKPTSDKPVFCSECFEGKRDNGGSRGGASSSPGITPEQFNQINIKLDKILEVLSSLEIISDDEEEEQEEESEKEE